MMRYTLLFISLIFGMTGLVCAQQSVPEGMARIEGGSYLPFYSPDQQRIDIESFYLDRYHVTNGEFLEFVRENPEWRRSNVKPVFADERYLSHWAGDLDLGPQADQLRDSPRSEERRVGKAGNCRVWGQRREHDVTGWQSGDEQTQLTTFLFPSRRRHTRWPRDWSSDVCSSDLDEWRIS